MGISAPVVSGGDTLAQAREQCLRALAACAAASEHALEAVPTAELDAQLRADLVVCAAVCRVAQRALSDELAVAPTLVQYAVGVCNRTAEKTPGDARDELRAVAQGCSLCAEAATTLLLVS